MSFIQRLLKHNTFKNVGYLVIGNVIGRALALIGVFYIPKLLGPEQYGIYNTVTAYVALFSVFTFQGLNKVIIRESVKDLTKAREILEETIGLRYYFSIIASALSIIVVEFVDYEIGTKVYIAIYSVSLLLTGFNSSLVTIYQSFQKMKALGVIAVIRPLIRVPLAIFFLKKGYGILSLIILDLVLEVFIVLFVYYSSKKLVSFDVFSKIKVTRKYLIPGIRFSLLGFLNTLSCKIDVVMLSFLTTPQNVGIYALAYRIVETGILLRQPISQSLFPFYSKKFSTTKPKIQYLAKHSAIISLPLFLLFIPISIFIEPIVPFVFGDKFSASAEIISVLIFYLIFYFALIPWGLFLEATKNEACLLYQCAICAIINIGLNIVLFEKYGLIGIAYSTLVVEFMRLFIAIIFSKRQLNIYNSAN
ncbi:MAG: flippase [Methylococcales bacterium]